jgi:cobalt/nickel transport system ATP-binding protein
MTVLRGGAGRLERRFGLRRRARDAAPLGAPHPEGSGVEATSRSEAERATPEGVGTPFPTPEAGPSPAPLLSVRGLRYRYEDGTEVDYGDTPLELGPAQRAVLLGPNGSGKSTLLLHVLGLLKAQQGQVQLFGHPADALPPEQRARIATLLQRVDDQIIGPTVWDDVAFTPRNLGLPQPVVSGLVEGALRRLEIWHLRARVPHALSAGERRKVALAGAIVFATPLPTPTPAGSGVASPGHPGAALGPRLLVLDEPFSSLDPRSRGQMLALIDELRRDHGTAVLLTTHWVQAVPEFADRVYVLAPGGRIAAQGTPEEVFSRPEVLEALDVEPPVLSQLFRSLERRGISLPPSLTVERAAEVLAGYCRAGRRIPEGRRVPDGGRAGVGGVGSERSG